MQSSAIAFSPSLSLSTHPRKLLVRGFNPLSAASPVQQHISNGFNVFTSARSLGPIRCSLKQNGWVSDPNSGIPEPESDGVVVRAAAEAVSPEESPKSKGFGDTLVLGTLFGLWYLFNIYFNIYNKQVGDLTKDFLTVVSDGSLLDGVFAIVAHPANLAAIVAL